MLVSGEEGRAGPECPGGQAVEGGQRSAEGAGGSKDGARSSPAEDEQDPAENKESERAEEVGGSIAAWDQFSQGEETPR